MNTKLFSHFTLGGQVKLWAFISPIMLIYKCVNMWTIVVLEFFPSHLMLLCTHQQAAKCFSLLSGPWQILQTGFFQRFCWKQLPAVAKTDTMRTERANQNIKLGLDQLNNELKSTVNLHKAADLSNNSQQVSHYKQSVM